MKGNMEAMTDAAEFVLSVMVGMVVTVGLGCLAFHALLALYNKVIGD